MTDSTPHPNAFVPVIVGWAEPPSMANNCLVLANWTLPRQEIQGDHPGVDVVFRLWQCDKKNQAGVKARR